MKIQIKNDSSLLNFVLDYFEQVSVTKAKKMILYNCFSLRGASIKSFEFILHKGDVIDYQRYSGGRHIAKEKRDISVLYEDEDVIIVNKPFAAIVSSKNKKQDTIFSLTKSYLRRKYRSYNDLFLVFAPQIDESGLCLFARNKDSYKQLMKDYENITLGIDAIVCRELKHKNDKIKSILSLLDGRLNMEKVETDKTKTVFLQYKTIESIEKDNEIFYHIHITQTTNIAYQSRFLLKQINNHVVGDLRFDNKQQSRNILKFFFSSIAFLHPITRKNIKIDSILPKNFNVFNAPIYFIENKQEEK
jgi:23S rRNA pseudouridine1911/1915/1917 synthase